MTANLLNTLVGLWLAHTAIFPNALLGMSRDRLVLIAAVATFWRYGRGGPMFRPGKATRQSLPVCFW
jgi:hypothetical protein